MSFDWKALVKGVAPILGSALGGPLVGTAVSALSNLFLGKDDGTEEELATALSKATPEQLMQLKQLDADFKLKMADLGLDPLRMEYADRASARDLFKTDAKPQRNITYLFLASYFLVLILVIAGVIAGRKLEIPPEFMLVFGVITGAIPQILAFWFGSTSGSAAKTEALYHATPSDKK